MKENDVLTELDGWIANCPEPSLVRRARDEIMALREMREAHIRMLSANCSEARADALEEAARVCEDFILQQRTPDSAQLRRSFAAAIRALKDPRDE